MAETSSQAPGTRLGLPEGAGFLEQGRARLARGERTFDLASLAEFDSTAVAVLLALRRAGGGEVRFLNPPPNLRKLALLYGVDELLFGAD